MGDAPLLHSILRSILILFCIGVYILTTKAITRILYSCVYLFRAYNISNMGIMDGFALFTIFRAGKVYKGIYNIFVTLINQLIFHPPLSTIF